VRLTTYEMRSSDHPILVEALRVLYIEALAELATKPLVANTPEQQLAWWQGVNHMKSFFWLLFEPERPWDPVGFVKLTRHDAGYYTPMFALAKRVHGKGYGREVIQFYLDKAKGLPLWGAQLVSNAAICHLNQEAGWIVKHEQDGVQHLFHPNHDNYPQRAYDEIVRYHS